MTSDLEELLHEGLDRLTADAKLPAGLVGRARLRNRQRRTAIRASVAAGTALAAAAAAIIVTSGAGRGPQGGGGGADADRRVRDLSHRSRPWRRRRVRAGRSRRS